MTDLGLHVSIRVPRPEFAVVVDLDVIPGETVAVVGPNGAGKTTLLRAVAGIDPAGGSIRIGSVEVGGRRADERPVGVLFQDLRLFPHLSALDNVAFPLRARGLHRSDARRRAAGELADLGLVAPLTDRRPEALSGGEAQRVALARALVADPAVVLLDEPFASLDAEARPAARTVVADALERFDGSALLVTHDPADAVVLADRMVVLEAGRITQQGRVADIARRPATRYAARLVGTNLLVGEGAGATLVTARGTTVVTAEELPSGRSGVVVPPVAVALLEDPPTGSPRNLWPGTVTEVEVLAGRARVTMELDTGDELVAEVTLAAVSDLVVRPGRRLHASVKATEVGVVALPA